MRLAPRSLLGRLTFAFVLIAVAAAALGIWGLNRRIHEAVRSVHEMSLRAVADPLTQRLQAGGVRALDAPLPAPLAARLDFMGGTVSYMVLDAQGEVLDASARIHPRLRRPDLAPARGDVTFRVVAPGTRFWGLSRRVETPEGPVVLQVGQDMTSAFVVLDEVPSAAFWSIVELFGGAAVLMLLANAGLARALLAPLRHAAAEAAAITPGSARRIGTAGMPEEVLPLIQAVNGALDRLEEALLRQRRFSQDVAHELRTPLAILMGEVDLLSNQAEAAELRRDLQALARLVDRLLEAAEAPPPPPEARTDLAAVCRAVAERLAPAAGRAGRRIALLGGEEPLWVRGDGEELGRAVRNLVENALDHAPAGTAVELRLLPPATVEVADRGPGVPEAQRALVFERFWRADRGGRRGSGIGLSLVAEIAARHGGSVTIRDNEGGGAVFALILPAADP
ncbi:sensor histidine kinase [Crenalkalicoccus roseus]|uniref:sensor histidine kinase n=1 Tax=Crenalkalicoccus roseus TaxID=1485588 RepID=UPI0013052083|nr:HAMP domain-containing sensor histidine kinase [Crenalkalicoccus roseus]